MEKFTAAGRGGDQTGLSVQFDDVRLLVVRCLRYGVSPLPLFIGFFCFRFKRMHPSFFFDLLETLVQLKVQSFDRSTGCCSTAVP